ncbi:MAG: orotidine-5'-phosphate decarboxylase [Patescibacteria group bacterium]
MGVAARQSILCLGLDPQTAMIAQAAPEFFKYYGVKIVPDDDYPFEDREGLAKICRDFCKRAIDEAGDEVVWCKLQWAFWGKHGPWGFAALEDVAHYARKQGLIVILDAKCSDGGDSAQAYAQAYLGAQSVYDALTINPSIGQSCLEPFMAQLQANNKAAFAVCRTSFKPVSAFEQLPVLDREAVLKDLNRTDLHRGGKPLPSAFEWILDHGTRPHWQHVAIEIEKLGQSALGACGWSNLGAVVGATSEESVIARQLMPQTWFLVPGYGVQGSGSDSAVLAADIHGFGITVNSSRGLLYPKTGTIGQAVHTARLDLNNALKRAGKISTWL